MPYHHILISSYRHVGILSYRYIVISSYRHTVKWSYGHINISSKNEPQLYPTNLFSDFHFYISSYQIVMHETLIPWDICCVKCVKSACIAQLAQDLRPFWTCFKPLPNNFFLCFKLFFTTSAFPDMFHLNLFLAQNSAIIPPCLLPPRLVIVYLPRARGRN